MSRRPTPYASCWPKPPPPTPAVATPPRWATGPDASRRASGVELLLPVGKAVVIQFLVDHHPTQQQGRLVSEPPPVIDQALVAAGLKAKLGPPQERGAVLSTAHELKWLTDSM